MVTLLTMEDYILRILPGLVLIVLFFFAIKPTPNLRIIIYIFAFVLMRDAMTPLGLWILGDGEVFLWIRLNTDPLFLVIFGICSLIIIITLFYFDKENRKYLVWFRKNKLIGLIYAIIACIAVVFPLYFIYRGVDINLRGGFVNSSLLIPILIFAILGNLFEEALFRGYVLGFLGNKQKPIIAGLNSGLVFAFCHIFLAITVTDIGVPLLLFTLWEGIIAGIVGTKFGIIPATITHGGAIFLLCSGLI